MARELDGFGRCPGCGADFSACVGVYHCAYGCEEPRVSDTNEILAEQIEASRYAMPWRRTVVGARGETRGHSDDPSA